MSKPPAWEPLVDLVVEGLGRGLVSLYRVHRLVRNPVHGDRRVRSGGPLDADPVIGRPEVPARGRTDHQRAGRQHERRVDKREARHPTSQRETTQQKREDPEPDRWLRAQDGETGEQGDAADRPDDVEGICPERRHRAEQRAERQRQRGHDRGNEDEHERQHDEVGIRGVALGQTEKDLVARAKLHVELRALDEANHEQ